MTRPNDAVAPALEAALIDRVCIGEIVISRTADAFALSHHDDETRSDLREFSDPEDAIELAKYDDSGNYRPLKTAPNLRHGWRLQLADVNELRIALDHLYPGRLAMFAAWKANRLTTTPLRATLDRQSGMYRIVAKIFDEQLDPLVANFCRSNGGCLRTILWKRDATGAIASTKLPPEKFDPAHDQVRLCSRRPAGDAHASHSEAATVPLLCQEACNLLVAKCRKIVKGESD